jgi:RimJ/RimL family protein N-acetyltransferase
MTARLSLQTPRLRLVAADATLIGMELGDRPALLAALGCTAPADWPPPLNDDATFAYFLAEAERDPSFAGWGYWYVIEMRSNEPIGICGFKGRPDKAGAVEIGYSIVPARQRAGFATEAVAALIDWCTNQGTRVVLGETYPDLIGSIRVMEKNGLVFDGEGSEPGVVRYRRTLMERA